MSDKCRASLQFVKRIIAEKINESPVVSESVLLMAQWLYDQNLSRGELIYIRLLLEQKPANSDCDISELVERIDEDLKLDS